MANILHSRFSNTMVACFTTVAFTTAILTPPQILAIGINLDLKAINFGIKTEKIFGKIKKSITRGETNKIIGYMFELKNEIEQYSGKKIDINKQIDQVQREAKAKGQKIDDRYIKQIKQHFHRENKKYKHRAVWFTECAEMNIPYSTAEADIHFDMNSVMSKSAKNGDKDIEVPVPVMIGVTVSLCGLFLLFVPIPVCQTAGGWLINTGISILGSEAILQLDQYDRNQKAKK